MAIRNIVKTGDETLTKKCKPVVKFDERLAHLLEDMKDTLEEANGVGLAAPQVGILRNIVIVDNGEEVLELINPVIICHSGSESEIEGCLSVPGTWGYVERPTKVTVKAQDRKGTFYETTGEGLTARCFCHEIDHLDGHLFTELVTEFVDPDEMEKDNG